MRVALEDSVGDFVSASAVTEKTRINYVVKRYSDTRQFKYPFPRNGRRL